MTEKQEVFTLLNGHVKMARSFYNPTSDAVWLAASAPIAAKTVLDVGIGTGGASLCLLAHFPDLHFIKKWQNTAEKLKQVIAQGKILVQRYHVTITNPPYFNGTPAKHNAHHNIDITRWITKCGARVKPNGHICIIVDALCAAKIISALDKKHFGNIEIFPLFGTKNTAERAIIRAKAGVKTGSSIYSELYMNNDTILRDGLTIDSLLSTLKAL